MLEKTNIVFHVFLSVFFGILVGAVSWIVAGVLVLLAAMIASANNWNALDQALENQTVTVAVLVGIVAAILTTILFIRMPREYYAGSPPSPPSGFSYYVCDDCRERVDEHARVCPHCGGYFTDTTMREDNGMVRMVTTRE